MLQGLGVIAHYYMLQESRSIWWTLTIMLPNCMIESLNCSRLPVMLQGLCRALSGDWLCWKPMLSALHIHC